MQIGDKSGSGKGGPTKDKPEAALSLAIPATLITLGSAFLYLIGYMFLVGFWASLGVDLSLLGFSTADILAQSYFPEANWLILVLKAGVGGMVFFIMLNLNSSVRARVKRVIDRLSVPSFIWAAAPFCVLSIIVLPVAADFHGKSLAKRFLRTAGSLNKVYVTFKPDLKQPDQHHVTMAGNAGRLFLLAQTKDLVIVAEKTGNSQMHTYFLSRSDLLSVEVDFSAGK